LLFDNVKGYDTSTLQSPEPGGRRMGSWEGFDFKIG